MPHQLRVDLPFGCDEEELSEVTVPPSYAVTVHPNRIKYSTVPQAFMSANMLDLLLVLASQPSLHDWLRTKAYDELWDYVKAVVDKLSSDRPTTTRIQVFDKDGTVRVDIVIPKTPAESIDTLRLEVKTKIETGSAEETIKVLYQAK